MTEGRKNLRFLANTAARDRSRSLASVNKTSLLGSVSLDFVRTGPLNMHRCGAFPFAFAGLFLSINDVVTRLPL